jgi:hypothetical protein
MALAEQLELGSRVGSLTHELCETDLLKVGQAGTHAGSVAPESMTWVWPVTESD